MTGPNRIPFLDLVAPHEELKEELQSVFKTALATADFIGGSMVAEFERDFAQYCDTRHCVGVGSGTDALRFILMAAGIKTGDIVVTVPNSFIATTEAISQAGGLPDFVDIDESTYNMDPVKLREYFEVKCYVDRKAGVLINRDLRRPVAAVVPVHLYGQTVDMDPILELAAEYNVMVIEDACQAHGAEYFSRRDDGRKRAGSMGRAAAFSFYPGKNLGACGEAGAITTNDSELAAYVRMIRDHGQAQKYYHDIEGFNGRLDAIQAGILGIKLRHLTKWNEQRRQAAARYHQLLAEESDLLILPHEPSWTKAVYHLYVIRVAQRNELQRYLTDAGIGTGIHYPVPLHLQKAYGWLGYSKGSFPIAEKGAAEILSLPMFPGLTPEQQSRVVERVLEFVSLSPSAAGLRHVG